MAQQTRNPTADTTFSGTWTGTPGLRFQSVDDHPDSSGADKLTHGTTSGVGLYSYSAFTVPAGSTITNVQVVYYDQKTAAQAASWGQCLVVGGNTQATNDAHNPSNGTWVLRTGTYTNNPVTGSPWTVDQVNGVGADALSGFGMRSTDVSPTCELASIQLIVNYQEPVPEIVDDLFTESQSTVARSLAAGALALSTALAGSFIFNDDILPPPPPPMATVSGGMIGERAIVEPTFQTWEQVDEIPTQPVALEVLDEYWLAPPPLIPEPVIHYFWFNDEVAQEQAPVAFDITGFMQRAVHEPTFKEWEQVDELPQAVAPDQQESLIIMGVGEDPAPDAFVADDDWVPPATPLPVDEAYWQVYTPPPLKPLAPLWAVEEELPLLIVDEVYWLAPQPPIPQPVIHYFWFNDEITQPPLTIEVDEYAWLPWQPWVTNPQVPQPFISPIFALGGMEGDLTEEPAPPGARKWLMDINTGAIYWKLSDPFIMRIA